MAIVVRFNPPSCPEIVAAGLPPLAVAGDSYCVPRLIPPMLNAVPPEMSPDFDGPLLALELAEPDTLIGKPIPLPPPPKRDLNGASLSETWLAAFPLM